MENIEKKRLLEEEEKALINSNETQISESNPSEHICRKVSEQCFGTLSSVAKARRNARNPLPPDKEQSLKMTYLKRLHLNFYSPKNTYLQYVSLENIKKVMGFRPYLEEIGIQITAENFQEILALSHAELERLMIIKKGLEKIGITLWDQVYDLDVLSGLYLEDILKLREMLPLLRKLGIPIKNSNLFSVCETSKRELKKLLRLKPRLDKVRGDESKKWETPLSNTIKKVRKQDLKLLAPLPKELKDNLTIWILPIALCLLKSADLQEIRNYHLRKAAYLKHYQTLSDQHYTLLFMEGGDEYWEDMLDDSVEELEEEFQEPLSTLRQPETIKQELPWGEQEKLHEVIKWEEGEYPGKEMEIPTLPTLWKYNKAEIRQQELWFCYGYSGIEMLKKSNPFEVLIKTSMKITEQGREIRLPFCWDERHRTWIPVSTQELDQDYEIKDKEEGDIFANINSDSALGFRILEIAAMKNMILSKDFEYPELSKQAWKSFNKTGTFAITSEMLGKINEWGFSHLFLRWLMGEGACLSFSTEDKEIQELLFRFHRFWFINIGISNPWDMNHFDPKYTKVIWDQNWTFGRFSVTKAKKCFSSLHDYSLERCFVDNETGEKKVIIVNPTETSHKIELPLERCMQAFPKWEIAIFDIREMFKMKKRWKSVFS